ncbi:MAG: MBL fold metallo-hydrolase [Verrucomicrobia bacterium]|nr:MBL fold metallo-hydrolase [Verrucomicrobiota bacterium]
MNSVLLIQQDEPDREALARHLRHAGWHVWECSTREEGLALARQHRPAVVLWHATTQGEDRFELCRDLRSDPGLAGVRIIVVRGGGQADDQPLAMASGADAFATAPVAPADLVRLITLLAVPSPGAADSANAAHETVVRFWGVRGSIPAPGRGTLEYGGNTSCIEVRADGEIIVLDSGSGIRLLGHELASEFKVRPLRLTILITHTHWDHIQGFPFFLPAYDRKNHIRILGHEGARESLTRIFSLQMEGPFFPIDFKELPGHIVIEELQNGEFSIGRVRVRTVFTNHPGACLGYRLTTDQGTIAYLPDNEPCYLVHPQARAQLGELGRGSSAAQAQEDLTREFIRGAEVVILDSQYDAREYKSRMGWGHGCVDDVVRLAIQAEVQRLYLFHHDPDHDDAKIASMVDQARSLAAAHKSPIVIEAAREGGQCTLRRP